MRVSTVLRHALIPLLMIAGFVLWNKAKTGDTVQPQNDASGNHEVIHRYFPIPDLRDYGVRDGIALQRLPEFWRTWSLVSVRYRSDSREQRFVYANPAAWKAMVAGKKEFPDGAMFGKLAFYTQLDSSFPVSLEPHGFDRLQVMKKDSRRYAATGGWGYAVVMGYETEKNAHMTSESENGQVAVTCHACHVLAEKRNYVFTRSPFLKNSEMDFIVSFKDKFRVVATQSLSPRDRSVVQDLTGMRPETVRYLSMNLFSGSINESLPALARFAWADHAIYLMSDPQSGHFAAAQFLGGNCDPGARVARTASNTDSGLRPTDIEFGDVCGAKVTWKSRFKYN